MAPVLEVAAVEVLRRVFVNMPTYGDGPPEIRFRIWHLVVDVVEEVEGLYWNYFQLRNPLPVEVEALLLVAEEGDHPSSAPMTLHCRWLPQSVEDISVLEMLLLVVLELCRLAACSHRCNLRIGLCLMEWIS